jgi:hypothetical protein
MTFFKLIRIVVLLSILFVIVIGTWMNERRLANWERPVWVTVYPITVNGSAESKKYAESLDEHSFDDINVFFAKNLNLYGVLLTPAFHFQVAPVSSELPPPIPARHSAFTIALWSLKMRWWSWQMDRKDDLISGDIQMFVALHEVGQKSEMNVSVGMRKGMYGLVKGYASAQASAYNQVVMAHEMLHVFGATDKYVMATGHPNYPDGYADPDKDPLFPQDKAEIMGGRVALSAASSAVPDSLAQCIIGHKTAEEIGLFDQLLEN